MVIYLCHKKTASLAANTEVRNTMTTIRKRGNSYQVQIRLKGHKPVNKSFKDKRLALTWIKLAY
ncbi:hypothetical protein NONS58_32020 [Nitrosococcus oceani]|nr:hypothetical protein NONS58_32020 [Nitrosococcus oceani]